jgi:hypothetical protein
MKLNLGCGRSPLEGWINVDKVAHTPLVSFMDLERHPQQKLREMATAPQSVRDACQIYEEFQAFHVLEHIKNVLPLMQWCWEVAKPGAIFTARVPYGSSDDADADPTHVRRFFLESWGYFGQPHHWRADYGYHGDWNCRKILLGVGPEWRGAPQNEVLSNVMHARNVVREMATELVAIKPARKPDKSLQTRPEIEIQVILP